MSKKNGSGHKSGSDMPKNPNPNVKHGTRHAYEAYGCRCTECVENKKEHNRKSRIMRAPREFVHGTYSGYSRHRCRCEQCRAANAKHHSELRARKRASVDGDIPWQPRVGRGSSNGQGSDRGRVMDWTEYALCREVDPDLFFPENNNEGNMSGDARAVCGRCIVREQCLEWALTATVVSAEDDTETYVEGILGGTTLKERKRMRAERSTNRRNA